MKKDKNLQLMEQREQSQVCLSSAESRQKKAKGQYVQANKAWLVAKSQEDGVKALPKGIFYKVLAEGDATSATPTPSSVITAHYTGKTIDGATFDSSRGDVPLACRLRDLIEGLSSPCIRCTSATDGRSTSPPKWATANSPSQVSPAAPPSSSTSSCSPSINSKRQK